MVKIIIPQLISLSFINAQIALPTFQAVHTPQTLSSSSSLYDFTSHTFTNCGTTGTTGPTLANCKSSYDVSWEDNTDYFNVPNDGGIQYWTVPATGTYTIEAWGSKGGVGATYSSYYVSQGGEGRKLKANFDLESGDVLKILVGQSGENTSSGCCGAGGGGGGTFITYSDNTPIIVASGGNGGNWGYFVVDGPDGLFSNAGNTNGGSVNGRGASGAGLTGDGTNYSRTKGFSFTNGGAGGTTSYSSAGDGGFGGGGSGYHEGGGGGGYNGGTVVNTNSYNTEYPSYGAGSFTADNASSIVNIGTNDGIGKVIITKN